MKRGEKKAAIELSIGTIVIIVLAMTMLILGIVLVTNIMRGTQSISDIAFDKIKSGVTNIFVEDQNARIALVLGADGVAKVKADGSYVGVGFGVKSSDGKAITDINRLKYTLTLDETTGSTNSVKNCVGLLGRSSVEGFFETPIGREVNFDQYDGSNAYAKIRLKINDGTPACSQKVFISVSDTNPPSRGYVASSFIIEVQEKGIFG